MEKKPKKEFKLDIFKLLSDLNNCNFDLINTLTEEEFESLSPLIVSQWMSGSGNPIHTILINELVNPFIWTLGSKHKALLVLLLAACGTQNYTRFKWKAMKSSKTKKLLAIDVIKQTYNYSSKKAQDVLHLLTKDDIIDLALELGWENDQVKLLKKELENK